MQITDIARLEYYRDNIITTSSDLVDHIPKIESLFRNSKLYKNYIYSIREGLQIKNCSYFIDQDFSEVDLELHHIFHLADIVLLVGEKMLDDMDADGFLTDYDIVRGVIDFHLKDYPIIMMLSTTIHQLHHTGQYDLPKNSKQFHPGNYHNFIQEYIEYLDKDEMINMYGYFGIDVSTYW